MGAKYANAKRADAWSFDPQDLVLVTDKKHPLYDPRVRLPLEESMVLNIMTFGVIEPVVIRRIEGDRAEVVDGRQRVNHAREANRRLIEQGKEPIRVAAVIRGGDEATLYGITISANEINRVDDQLAKAEKARRFIELKGGATPENLRLTALYFGVSVQTIRNWLELDELPADVKQAVAEKRIAPTAARQLKKMDADQRTKVLKGQLDLVDEAEGKFKPNEAGCFEESDRYIEIPVAGKRCSIRFEFNKTDKGQWVYGLDVSFNKGDCTGFSYAPAVGNHAKKYPSFDQARLAAIEEAINFFYDAAAKGAPAKKRDANTAIDALEKYRQQQIDGEIDASIASKKITVEKAREVKRNTFVGRKPGSKPSIKTMKEIRDRLDDIALNDPHRKARVEELCWVLGITEADWKSGKK